MHSWKVSFRLFLYWAFSAVKHTPLNAIIWQSYVSYLNAVRFIHRTVLHIFLVQDAYELINVLKTYWIPLETRFELQQLNFVAFMLAHCGDSRPVNHDSTSDTACSIYRRNWYHKSQDANPAQASEIICVSVSISLQSVRIDIGINPHLCRPYNRVLWSAGEIFKSKGA